LSWAAYLAFPFGCATDRIPDQNAMRIDIIGVVTLILVFLAWFVFGAIFLLRKKPPKAEETKRVVAAKWGIALQGVGFALVGSFHRTQVVAASSFTSR
jgi:hypothetical protein